ncbi:MAG: MATE family efflux transporter [Synergistaceae bacterium]|nr:MATE family efflux transporter [Synergistaceae bacterium]
MKDMTEGNITKQMLTFSMPLMLANFFQQLYGVANTIIVGRYLGKGALAAMGGAIPFMDVMMFLLVGMTMGASILMAEYFGSGDIDRLRMEIATSIVGGAAFTILLSLAALCCISPALRLINTPQSIAPQSASYLRIIFAGLIFTFLYNILSSALRSIGESAVPLYLLIFSSLLNIALADAFVGRAGLGVNGAAYATVISQAAAALACFVYIRIKAPLLRLSLSDLKINLEFFSKTASYSWISGVQQTFLYVGIFLLQGAVNPLGIDSIAAFNAASRVDSLIMAPSDSLALSLMMFISQNNGAGKRERIRAGFVRSMFINCVYTASAVALLLLFSDRIAALFLHADEPDALALCAHYLSFMAFFYLLSAFCNTFQGYFRGIGKMGVTLYATLIQIPIRVGLSYLLAGRVGMDAVATGIGAGWIFMTVYQVWEYRRYIKGEHSDTYRLSWSGQ